MAEIALIATNGKNPATGYGKLEMGLERGLEAAGFEVLPKARARTIAIVTGDPRHAEDIRSKTARLWAYTMSEADRVSGEWVDCLNARFERVLVPCPGLVDVYQASGVVIPVSYVPMGVDFTPIPYIQRRKPEVFTFLTYSLGDMRKGAHLVMFAFNRLFKGNEKVRLVIKCRDDLMWLEGLQDDQISIVQGETSEDAWHDLLAQSHCFVFPSYGEGFGLPPREAVLSGLPTIATKWLGMWDVDYWGYPLRVNQMLPAQFDFWEANAEGSRWAEPCIQDLDRWMMQIYKRYELAILRTQRARAYLLQNFTWRQTGQAIARLAHTEEEAHDARVPAH